MKSILKLKNFLKANLNPDGNGYRVLRKVYESTVFPLERRAWAWGGARGKGFEHDASLHMCSLLPRRTLDSILQYYRPKTWLDVGCGTGAAMKYVRKAGVEVWGLEQSSLAIRESGIEEVIEFADLTQPVDLRREFDIAWCYEVAEHLPESAADVLVDTLERHSATVVLSAAIPGQGGEGHINEQPLEYWGARMQLRGYKVDQEITRKIHGLNELYSANLVCFRRTG